MTHPAGQTSSGPKMTPTERAPLDYFGVRPDCGCVTAWMSSTYSTPSQIRDFYVSMADTGREVRQMEFTEEIRQRLAVRCPHGLVEA